MMGERHGEPWEDYELEFLRENITRFSIRELAERLGRFPEAVRAQARLRRLSRVDGVVTMVRADFDESMMQKWRRELE